MSVPLQQLPAEPAPERPHRKGLRSRGPGRRGLAVPLVALALVAAAAVGVVRTVSDLLPDGRPFDAQSQTTSSQTLLLAAQDLQEYRGATGTFQVLVEREESQRYVPGWVVGETTTLSATGTVDGLVDLSDLAGRVDLSDDGRTARFRLPAAVLGPARLDMANTRVVDRDRGIGTRIGGALADDPVDDSELLRDAERRIAGSAAQSDLRERTERGARDTLTQLARALGATQVEVVFDPPTTPLP